MIQQRDPRQLAMFAYVSRGPNDERTAKSVSGRSRDRHRPEGDEEIMQVTGCRALARFPTSWASRHREDGRGPSHRPRFF